MGDTGGDGGLPRAASTPADASQQPLPGETAPGDVRVRYTEGDVEGMLLRVLASPQLAEMVRQAAAGAPAAAEAAANPAAAGPAAAAAAGPVGRVLEAVFEAAGLGPTPMPPPPPDRRLQAAVPVALERGANSARLTFEGLRAWERAVKVVLEEMPEANRKVVRVELKKMRDRRTFLFADHPYLTEMEWAVTWPSLIAVHCALLKSEMKYLGATAERVRLEMRERGCYLRRSEEAELEKEERMLAVFREKADAGKKN